MGWWGRQGRCCGHSSEHPQGPAPGWTERRPLSTPHALGPGSPVRTCRRVDGQTCSWVRGGQGPGAFLLWVPALHPDRCPQRSASSAPRGSALGPDGSRAAGGSVCGCGSDVALGGAGTASLRPPPGPKLLTDPPQLLGPLVAPLPLPIPPPPPPSPLRASASGLSSSRLDLTTVKHADRNKPELCRPLTFLNVAFEEALLPGFPTCHGASGGGLGGRTEGEIVRPKVGVSPAPRNHSSQAQGRPGDGPVAPLPPGGPAGTAVRLPP